MNKTKVLITGPGLEGFSGGQQTHVRNVIHAFRDNEKIKLYNFVNTLALQEKERYSQKILRNILLIVPFFSIGKKADVIHLNASFDDKSVVREMTYLLIAFNFLNKKVIWQFHGGIPDDVSTFKNPFSRFFCEIFFTNVRKILILSADQIDSFKKIFPKLENLEKIYNYIEIGKENDVVNIKNRKQGLTTFLFMGRLHESKGLKELVRAAEILWRQTRSIRLIVCGEGPLKKWLKSEIERGDKKKYIEYRGVVLNENKNEIYQISDVLIMPTRHKEGVPYAILEAFKFGLPVISSKVGAIPEMIIHGRNGFIVNSTDVQDIADKMMSLCKQETIYEMGQKAKEFVRLNFSIRSLEKKLEEYYLS